MPNTTTQCQTFNRTSLTNGASGILIWFALAISKLEVDESTSAGSAETQIQNHEDGGTDPDDTGLKNSPPAGLVAELVKPDHRHQHQHERRHLRVMPRGGENAFHNQQRIVQ